ncbi:MAG: cytochrome P460 family protein [Proteobacteria bacterium]|nr:cytochrome P460 family protein [Pseudomonadota bacterium]
MKTWLVSVAVAIALVGGAARAGTENVAFPKGYAENYVLYTTVNKPNAKSGDTLRKFYINKSAMAAYKASKALPSGTILVREDWFTKKDTAKKSIIGPDGKFVTTKKKAVVVSEKRDGWGADYPAGMRNGNWEYAAFNANGERNPKANIKRCFGCHLSKKNDDFIFTMKALRTAAK